MKSKKALGQNFLVNKTVVSELIKTADLSNNDTVLEIGAGKGFVTEELAKLPKKVIAVEFDSGLISTLKSNLGTYENVEIVNQNILSYLDSSKKKHKVVGSIPYQITSPLIHKLLTLKNPPLLITLLVQYEVAKKITALPPKATYLSNFVQTFADVKYIKKVSKKAFRPIPKVDGAIIKIIPHAERYPLNAKSYSKFLHKGFSTPRKMLNKVFNPDVLKATEINPKRRPQELETVEWMKLFNLTSR